MSMPQAVRHINEVRIVDALYRHGTTTRATLARDLGLMRSTVGNLVAGLAARGLILEGEGALAVPTGRSGRPGQQVRLNAAHATFIGADIGVGHLSVVAMDLLGQPFKSRSQAFEPPRGDVEATVAALAAAVRAVIRQLPDAEALRGICVTVPGLVGRDGVVLRAPVLGWHDVPVQRLLAERLKWRGPLSLENDANAFAATELFGRAPADHADALFIYLDAGIGGGVATHGRLLRGHRGFAGEIGHIHLGEDGFDAHTPVQGSFESYVGRNAVVARYRQHGGKGQGLDAVLADAAARRPAALRTLAEWAWWMGRGLASLISVVDPGRIVLGGPVAALHALVATEVVASVRKHLVQPFSLPPIEVSRLGTDACAIGAATLLHQRMLAFDERLVYGGAPGGAGVVDQRRDDGA